MKQLGEVAKALYQLHKLCGFRRDERMIIYGEEAEKKTVVDYFKVLPARMRKTAKTD
jgi:hypothetical protein